MNTLPLTAPQVPSVAFALYQLQFATVTAAIIFGAASERFRILPGMIFVFLWTTFVYDFVAYWTWGARGWVKNLACLNTLGLDSTPCAIGSYDYAGGGPVHVASGFAGLAYAMLVGKRKGYGVDEFRPHNLFNVFLGTALLWFGWFGFNGGSAIASSPRAAMAAFVTVVAAACGALSWTLLEFIQTKKWSAEAFCAGAVSGLVVITPASGYVAPWAAIVMGLSGGLVVAYSVKLKSLLGIDDALDAFGLHGVGGIWGNLLTGIFAQKWIGSLDGSTINGGWIEGNWIQFAYQLAGTIAIASFSFGVSYILLFILNKIPGLQLRTTEEEERMGADLGEMGELAYEPVSDHSTQKLKASPAMKSTESSHTVIVPA
jgi:Amt family ammonium transporter